MLISLDYGIYAAQATAHLPHDADIAVRHNRRMDQPIDVLIARIAAKLAERNLTEREASLDATGKPDALRYVRTRRAMPSAERLDKIAETLGTTAAWLIGRANAEEHVEEPDTATRINTLKTLPKNLPIYGTALGADLDLTAADGESVAIEQTEVNMAEAQDYMPRPTSIAGRADMYVVIVAGDSMVPRHDAGRRLLVDGKRAPMAGDDVVVQLRTPNGHDGEEQVTAVLIKQLVKRKAGSYVLRQFNPFVEFELPNEKVRSVHRVIPWDVALGF